MSATVTWHGLDQLRAELRALPAELTDEAAGIVNHAAAEAKNDIVSIYNAHRLSGNLADHVTIGPMGGGSQLSTRFGVGVVVKSTSRIAWLFDHGSQARHWARGKSTGTMWGHTPPTHAFVATMRRRRREMYESLTDLLVRKGLRVSGHV